MRKEHFFTGAALVAIIVMIYLVVNLETLFPLPSEQETVARLSQLDNVSKQERGTNASATVLVEEFSDFECPYCKNAVGMVSQLHTLYGDKINFVYKHAPLTSVHPNAKAAAEAAECARDQEKFWAYHDKLFENQNALDESSLKTYAVQLQLDPEQFNECFENHEKAFVVEADMNEALRRGVQGTPTFFINNKKVLGADFDQIKKEVEEAS